MSRSPSASFDDIEDLIQPPVTSYGPTLAAIAKHLSQELDSDSDLSEELDSDSDCEYPPPPTNTPRDADFFPEDDRFDSPPLLADLFSAEDDEWSEGGSMPERSLTPM